MELNKRLISCLSYGISIEARPFRRIGEEFGISEDEVIEKIRELKDKWIIRFFRSSIDYRKIGYPVNVMACFLVAEDAINNIAKGLSKYKMVSHCYRRLPVKSFPYNLFLMLHGKTKDGILSCVKGIKMDFSLDNYLLLFTKREFKRQRPRIKEIKN